MSLRKTLSPEVETRVQQVLNQTDWEAKFPKFADRMTAYREAREAQAEQARYANPGGRYGS